MPWLDSLMTTSPGASHEDEDEDEHGSDHRHSSHYQSGQGQRGGRRLSSFSYTGDHRSPLERWLPYLNVGLCVVLVGLGQVTGGSDKASGTGLIGLGTLPALVYGVVLIAKMLMASVDPERELTALRYEYKGA
jgi:hypothetical protein